MLRRKAPRIIIRFSSAAAKSVADNDDLLLVILLRLPIRSLLRFKSVSKRWLSLISNPDFSHRRITFHPPTPSGIFLSRPFSRPAYPGFDFVDLRPNPPRVPFESLELSLPKRGTVILQSCNGLLLCYNEGRSYRESDYYVFNPTTKQYTTLPKLPIYQNRVTVSLNLAYDPLRSSNYKVVCIRILDSENYQIKIYSPDSGFWRSCCNDSFPTPFNQDFDCGVYWNGAVHWFSCWGNCVYLDLSEEKLHELAVPRASEGWEDRRVEYFGNCCGHLYWIERVEVRAVELIVYEMEDDRHGWFVKYRVDLQWVSSLFPTLGSGEVEVAYSEFTVLAIVDRSEVGEEPYVVLHSGGNAARVNAKSGSFERLVYILNNGRTFKFPIGFKQIDAHLYIESLACV